MITQNIIGYDLSARSEKTIYAADPATLETLPGAFSPATAEEVDLALTKAHAAWRIYRSIDGARRGDFLKAIADGIEALGDTLVQRICRETAYPEARVVVERTRTCAQLRMFAEIAVSGSWRDVTIDPALPERKPLPGPELRKMMMPLGPVVVFGAGNFPLAYSTAGGDTASALAVGCPVVVKAHDAHPGTNALVAEVIMKAAQATGMPGGVFSSLNGDGFETGKQLVLHPMTAAVGFTGSLNGGRALFDLANTREKPVPVFAEMGSVNPVFLLPGRVAENPGALAAQLAGSMTMTAGQFCTNPGIIIAIRAGATPAFMQHLRDELEKVPGAVMLGKGIRDNFRKGIGRIGGEPGVNWVFPETSPSDETGAGHVVTPALAEVPAHVFMALPQLHHEVFGPFSLLVLCDDISQMLDVAGLIEGQLTASVHATAAEAKEVGDLVDIVREKAGRIVFNGVPTGVEVCAAMTHGGPYPASTDSRFTAVGHHAVRRWVRPVTYQDVPEWLLLTP